MYSETATTEAKKTQLSKYWRLFELELAVIYAFSVCSAIAVLHHAEWHEPLHRLLGRSWDAFVAQDVGSTTRGFVNASMEAIFSIFVVAVMIAYLRGFTEFRKHLMETAIIALFATAAVYGTQFVWG